MGDLTRRRFVQSVAALVPVAALPLGAGSRRADAEPLDERLLRAVAEAVLPSELGRDGMTRVVTGFQRWLAGYRPGAELDHGYGTAEIDHAPASPASRWQAQLEALDGAARERFGARFPSLDPAERSALVAAALGERPADRLPPAVEAPHVAVGLLAHFYDTPDATDLCYRAAIGRYGCRPLASSPERPGPRRGGA